ncbi:MAG: hypothetical protein HY908_24370 [Myxococcales bacterium]|nr:hypothetical protein [Myxococcales bacterium]
MVRSMRRVRSMVGAVLIGLAVPSALVAAVSVSGCGGDERDPMTHVDRLTKPGKRNAAVERLLQMFNDHMSQAENRDAPLEDAKVKALLDKIVEPLATVAAGGELEEVLQAKLLNMLADSRHEKAADALVKAMDAYKADQGRPGEIDSAMNNVVRAVGSMKLKAASGALLKLFLALPASSKKAQNKTFYQTVDGALIDLLDPAWEDQLIKALDKPFDNSLTDMTAASNEQFWQATSAKLLGYLKSKKAVPSLIKAVISPYKAKWGIGTTALIALIRVGKPSMEAALKVLTSDDKDIVDFSKKVNLEAIKATAEAAKRSGPPTTGVDWTGLLKVDDKEKDKMAATAHIASAAIILASLGRAEATPTLIAAIKAAGDDAVLKAQIANELAKLPKSAESEAAWKEVYAKTPAKTKFYTEDSARLIMLNQARLFYDPDIAAFAVQDALELKEDDARTLTSIQSAALLLALKLVGEGQLDMLDKLAALRIKPSGADAQKGFDARAKMVKEITDGCKEMDNACIAKILETYRAKSDIGLAKSVLPGGTSPCEARECFKDAFDEVKKYAKPAMARLVYQKCAPKGGAAAAEADKKCFLEALAPFAKDDDKTLTTDERTEAKSMLSTCKDKDAGCFIDKTKATFSGDENAFVDYAEVALAKTILTDCKDAKDEKCYKEKLKPTADKDKDLHPTQVDTAKGLLNDCDGSKEPTCLKDGVLAVDSVGEDYSAQMRQVKALLTACKGKGPTCYLAKMEEPASQDPKTSFQGVKAAYMLAILGDESSKDKLIEILPKMKSASVRDAAVSVLDRLCGKGDAAMADKLQALLDKTRATRDDKKIGIDTALYGPVIARLRARAE